MSFFASIDHLVDDVIHTTDADHLRGGHATLSGATAHAGDHVARGHLQMRIGQYEQMVLGAAQAERTLQGARGTDVNDLGHLGAAHEAHGLDAGVIADGLHDRAVAVHHVEDAIGQARFLQ